MQPSRILPSPALIRPLPLPPPAPLLRPSFPLSARVDVFILLARLLAFSVPLVLPSPLLVSLAIANPARQASQHASYQIASRCLPKFRNMHQPASRYASRDSRRACFPQLHSTQRSTLPHFTAVDACMPASPSVSRSSLRLNTYRRHRHLRSNCRSASFIPAHT